MTHLKIKKHTGLVRKLSLLGYFGIFLCWMLLLLSCGKVANSPLGNSVSGSTAPSDAILETVSYQQNGATQIVYGPFLTTLTITPDFPSGGCSQFQALITIAGNFDSVNATSVVLTGLTTTQTISGGTFTMSGCASLGTLALTVTSVNAGGGADLHPAKLSLDIANPTNQLTTIGFGSPSYPATGFQVLGNQPNVLSMTSNGITLENSVVGSYAQITPSTNTTGYFLFTGFTDYVAQVSP